MKPKPLVALNHFTVPIVIYFSKMRKCALRPHDLRAGLIRFQRCLGEGSRFGAINKQIDCSNAQAFTPSRAGKQAIRNGAIYGRRALVRFRSIEAVSAPRSLLFERKICKDSILI